MGHRLIIYIAILHVTTFFYEMQLHSLSFFLKKQSSKKNSITHDSLQKTHTHTYKSPSHTFIYSLSHIHTLICNITHTNSHQQLHTPLKASY